MEKMFARKYTDKLKLQVVAEAEESNNGYKLLCICNMVVSISWRSWKRKQCKWRMIAMFVFYNTIVIW